MKQVRHQKPLYIIYSILSISILSFLFINNIYADESSNLNYSVTVEPALNITTSSNKVSLDLNPLSHDFDSQDLTVSVSTNNETGYKLYVNTDSTKLVEKDDNNLYIETLADEVPDDADSFTANRWGYRIGSGNYLPFESGILLNSSKTQVENNSSTLTFAAKVGYETKAGSYALALNFQATANPAYPVIQDFTKAMCQELATNNSTTVIDSRDGNDYQVRYINGNCWMVQNLRYVGDTGSTSNSMTIKAATTNVAADMMMAYTDLTTEPYSDYNNAKIHNSGNTINGVWYNYAAASVMTIIGENNGNVLNYDICPRNWHLPTDPEYNGIISYATSFNPVIGGYYGDSTPTALDNGFWWSATKGSSNQYRLFLQWNGTILHVYNGGYPAGMSLRCIRAN